jgi:uncharacterized protein YjiS (DUF1127 family)
MEDVMAPRYWAGRRWQALDRVLTVWRRRCRERRELAEMTLYELRDAGLSTAQVWQEIRKPFWRA